MSSSKKSNKKKNAVAVETAVETARETRAYEGPNFSIGDPALAAWLGISARSNSGVMVTEGTSLGIPAVFRSVSLLSGVIGSLPLKSYRLNKDGEREQVSSFLDNPHPEMTQFEWVRLVITHQVFRGNAFLLHMYNNAGGIYGLQPIHPGCVVVKMDNDKYSDTYGRKLFTVTIGAEQRIYTSEDILHIPGVSMDGLVGVDPLTVLRDSFGTSLASEEARGRQFANGGMISGIVTTEEDLDEDEARIIKQDLSNRVQGSKNAGDIAFVNRSLKFTPWMMSNRDAEFVATLAFQIDEVSRIFGLPNYLLGSVEKQTSWGTGIAEQNLALQKYTLIPITSAVEQRLSLLLSRPTKCEFDYKALFAGTPEQEINMLIAQKDAGVLTLNEVRKVMNLPPLPGGDVMAPPTIPAQPVQPPQGA